MKFQKKYKIALVGYRLGGGGSDKVMANLSCFLYDCGIDVHIITVIDEYGYSYKGKVISTEKLKVGNGILNRITRVIALKKIFSKEKYDYIIDFRFRNKPFQEFLISKYLYKSSTIFTIHSSALENYIPISKFWANKIYKNSFAIVAVSNFIKTKIEEEYRFKNVKTIYNTIDFNSIEKQVIDTIDENYLTDYILAVGQIDTEVKQMDHLIKAYHISQLDLPLVICGKGKLREKLMKLTEKLGISNKVHFLGYQENPYKYMKRAKFLVMTSAFEGFPNVLIESLCCGTPVISYDCLSGPSEIIVHEHNGLLVKNQDSIALTDAMIRFNEDEILYTKCKSNAKESVIKFDLNFIGKEWLEVMEIEV